MQKKTHPKKEKINVSLFLLIAIGVILGLVALFFYTKDQLPKEPYQVPHYEKLSWEPETAGSVYALLAPDTADEEIKYTEGKETTAEDTQKDPEALYTYYDEKLIQDGFEKINLVGNPKENNYWVSSYKKNHYYVEVQYYVTPDNKDTRTSMLFTGILPD